MTSEAANVEQVATGDLIPHPDNPRRGDVKLIAESIEANGWYGTIVAQRSTGHVLAGNHRLLAAQQAGIETVPVYWVDVDDDAARRILLADNRTGDLAGYDNDQLAEVLAQAAEFGGLGGTGWSDIDLEALRTYTDFDDLDALLDEVPAPTSEDGLTRVVLMLTSECAEALNIELSKVESHSAAVENWLDL